MITFLSYNQRRNQFKNSLESLAKEIINSLENEDDVKMKPSERPAAADATTSQIDIKKKPGRAFLHKLTGKFLAESGIKCFWLTKQYEPASTRRRRNLKTQLYFYGYACRPHCSTTKTELSENAF